MFRAIVFDFDGIIADTEPLHYEAFSRVLRPMGVGFGYDHYLRHYVGLADRDLFERIRRERGWSLDGDAVGQLVERKSAALEVVVREGVRPCPGAVELILGVAGQLPLAICSGALRSDIEHILPVLADGTIASAFSAVVTADEVTASKPDPSSYILAAQRLGLPTSACLAIEDTVPGIQSARAAGLPTLGVANTYPLELLEGADRVVPTLEGVDLEKLRAWFG